MKTTKTLGTTYRYDKTAAIRVRRATDWKAEFAYASQPIELGFVVIGVGHNRLTPRTPSMAGVILI